ncbi:winged helix-turn-helix transcriptional regulator [Nocardia rhamnosiphila]
MTPPAHTLTPTLRQLQQDDLITRTAYAEVPRRVEYGLTSLGHGIHEIVATLIGWAADHHDEIRDHRARAHTLSLNQRPLRRVRICGSNAAHTAPNGCESAGNRSLPAVR